MSKDLVVKESYAVDVPDFMKNGSGVGFDDIQGAEIDPFVTIAQTNSDELMEGDTKHIPGLKVGDIFNKSTREIYGQSINVCFIGMRYIYNEWLPNQGGYVGEYSYTDGLQHLNTHGVKEGGNIKYDGGLVTIDDTRMRETIVYYALNLDTSEPIILSLDGGKLKKAKEINTTLKAVRRKAKMEGYDIDGFSVAFKLTTFLDTGKKSGKKFQNYQWEKLGFINEDQYKLAKEMRSNFEAGSVSINMAQSDIASEDEGVPF